MSSWVVREILFPDNLCVWDSSLEIGQYGVTDFGSSSSSIGCKGEEARGNGPQDCLNAMEMVMIAIG